MHRMMASGGRNNCRKSLGDYSGDESSKQPMTQPKDVKHLNRSQFTRTACEPCRTEPHQWGMEPPENNHDEIRIVSAVALLSLTAATPSIAQEVIYNPGYCAQFYPNANCQKGPNNPYTGD